MRLAVFGGAFDPPHNAHLALCLYARELLPVDRLVISVSNNPLKEPARSTDRDRVKMADLLTEAVNATGPVAEACCWEVSRGQSSYTIDLVNYLEEIYTCREIILLIGEDNYRLIRKWKSWEELVERCSFVVFGRSGEEGSADTDGMLNEEQRRKFRHVDFNLSLSSTGIRERIASGKDCSSLIPSSIWEYIVKEGLYLQKTP